jgi:hypothetical protein
MEVVEANEAISLTAFTTLPQAVRDWIEKELRLKRVDVHSVHIVHSRPKFVTVENIKQEKHTARFSILKSGMWKKAKGGLK